MQVLCQVGDQTGASKTGFGVKAVMSRFRQCRMCLILTYEPPNGAVGSELPDHHAPVSFSGCAMSLSMKYSCGKGHKRRFGASMQCLNLKGNEKLQSNPSL